MNGPAADDSGAGGNADGSIYIVDDEPMLLELARVILEPLGYQIKTFRDPGEALEAYTAAATPPVLVITDYSMHDMSGTDLMEACRRLHPGQKVLLVSGTVGTEVFAKTPQKPDQFLAKPYHARQLSDLVKSLLPA
jgi:two-component system, cell cycle sensor histidine kinase and response regulator CckA